MRGMAGPITYSPPVHSFSFLYTPAKREPKRKVWNQISCLFFVSFGYGPTTRNTFIYITYSHNIAQKEKLLVRMWVWVRVRVKVRVR